jgi:hypothetical protein
MSTFTTIKTAIRDSATMLRILKEIPGAKVSQNVRLKRKGWGSAEVAFYVELSLSASSDRLIGPFVTNGLRYFYVTREADGTLALHVNQDQADHLDIEHEITSAVSAHHHDQVGHVEQHIRQKRNDALGAIESIASAQRARLALAARKAPEISSNNVPQTGATTSILQSAPESVNAEATAALEQMDRKTESKQPPQPRHPSDSIERSQKTDGDAMAAKLAQEYARQKVLEQLDQIEQLYGVRLSGENILDDGTIELTLRG